MINQKYHFDITPHIVKQLGEQLVSDEIYNPQNHPSTFSKRSVSILRFFSKTKRLF